MENNTFNDNIYSLAPALKIQGPENVCQVIGYTAPDPGFGFGLWRGPSRAPKAQGQRRREYMAVPPPQKKISFWGLEMRILVRSDCLLRQFNTCRSRPPVRLPGLTFQADCGSIKDAAGVSAETPAPSSMVVNTRQI